MRGSEPLGLGSNPGWVALDCSGQWCPTGLENQAVSNDEGSTPLLSAWIAWRWAPSLLLRGFSRKAGGSIPLLSAAWVLGHKGGCNPLDFGLAEFDSQTSNWSATKVVALPAKQRSRVRLPGGPLWAIGVNGSTPVLQAGCRGSNPRLSTGM